MRETINYYQSLTQAGETRPNSEEAARRWKMAETLRKLGSKPVEEANVEENDS